MPGPLRACVPAGSLIFIVTGTSEPSCVGSRVAVAIAGTGVSDNRGTGDVDAKTVIVGLSVGVLLGLSLGMIATVAVSVGVAGGVGEAEGSTATVGKGAVGMWLALI